MKEVVVVFLFDLSGDSSVAENLAVSVECGSLVPFQDASQRDKSKPRYSLICVHHSKLRCRTANADRPVSLTIHSMQPGVSILFLAFLLRILSSPSSP